MDDYDSYHDNDVDWMSMCAEMSNTIDALNTNIILLNKFIESAVDLYDCSMNFKENIEITTFDDSGNIMTCVKSDGSGYFLPCVFMDLSCNMIHSAIPDDNNNTSANSNRERSFSPLSPYYYPYYSPYYSPYYNPYYSPYYNPYYSLLNNTSSYRDIPVKNMMNTNLPNGPTNRNSPHHQSYIRPPNRPSYRQSYHRPSYHQSYYRPSYHRPPYYPIYNCPQCHPIHHRGEHDDCINN